MSLPKLILPVVLISTSYLLLLSCHYSGERQAGNPGLNRSASLTGSWQVDSPACQREQLIFITPKDSFYWFSTGDGGFLYDSGTVKTAADRDSLYREHLTATIIDSKHIILEDRYLAHAYRLSRRPDILNGVDELAYYLQGNQLRKYLIGWWKSDYVSDFSKWLYPLNKHRRWLVNFDSYGVANFYMDGRFDDDAHWPYSTGGETIYLRGGCGGIGFDVINRRKDTFRLRVGRNGETATFRRVRAFQEINSLISPHR